MKIIEKKCLNCGANLKINKNDTEITCDYCNATFLIDREMHDELGDFSTEFINLQRKNVKRISKIIIFFDIVIFIIVIAIIFIVFFKISRGAF